MWVLLAEMFPNRIRGVATAIANMALWAMNFVVSQSFPSLLSSIGPGKTFWIYGGAALFTFLFTLSRVPETKGKSLEEIEAIWEKNPAPLGEKRGLAPSWQEN
ncbi:Arabinose-proton symporter [compost metagenome]